jgi:hypothetical protein
VNERRAARPIWSGSGSATVIDFTGPRRGAFFSHWFRFLCLAAEARDEARKMGTGPGASPAKEALNAILFSALAVEAFINELAEAAARNPDPLPESARQGAQALADLAALLSEIEDARGPIGLKYQLTSKILRGETFVAGRAPFQDFADLVRLRDELVHPRHRDKTTDAGHVQPVSRIVRDLQQRGLTTTTGRRPGDVPGGISWLDEIQSGGVANWAYKAAREIIVAVLEMLPDDDNLSTTHLFRNRLDSMPQ